MAILTGVVVLLAFATAFAITIIHYQRKKVAVQRARVKAEINSLEEERTRIASDLHDDLGASLSAIKLRLHCIETQDKEDANLIRQSEFYIDEAMKKVRRISFNVMPQILHRNGLSEALNELIEMLIPTTGIKINYACEVEVADTQKRIHIYRIVQEVLNNIIRHSQATRVDLSLKPAGSMIRLCIRDNGIGFDKNMVTKKSKGQGLRNIMARAELLNATVKMETEQGQGVDYLIKIPYT